MTQVILDIETNSLTPDTIWCVVCQEIDSFEFHVFTEPDPFNSFMEEKNYDKIIGHNILAFDAPILRRLWNANLPHKKLFDTMILGQIANPIREQGHSLDAWGWALKCPKGNHSDWSIYSKEMLKYCKLDVTLTQKVYLRLREELRGFSLECIQLEHDVKRITTEQEQHGFYLNQLYTMDLVSKLDKRLIEIRTELQKTFPPKRIETKLITKTKVEMEEFNVGSRKQIAERLQEKGWKPKRTTDKGSIIVDERVLRTIDMPEAKLISEYLMLQKRIAQLNSWLEALDHSPDDRVHGQVLTLRTITGRMAHAKPNMAQVPASYSPYGSECRTCWTVPEGRVLVGIDASGLELRMLAHYMNDKSYIKEVLEGDIHTVNQKNAGLQTRDQAKTFIYALLYGAGAKKIGAIIGRGSKEGKKLIENFLNKTPALGALRERVLNEAGQGWVRGLDNRKLLIRSSHSALNTKLQGGGAIVMKKALVLFDNWLSDDVKIVANIHDEWQVECDENDGDVVGKFGVTAIMKAGDHFKMNCPLTGEYKIGTNWMETH
jgi:DNA polymerase I-like protein with 3'-5' exonuclease and polymerase domains